MWNKLKKIIVGMIAFVIALQVCYFSPNTVEATLTKKPTPTQVSEIKSYGGTYKPKEYYIVRTPLNEKKVLYVQGRTQKETKMLCIRLKKHNFTKTESTTSAYVMTTFVTPNEKGEFSIKVDLTKGNKNVPEVINGKGEVAQKKDSYSTRPGYKAVETIGTGSYYLTIMKTLKDVDLKKDVWESTLNGRNGYALRGIVLTVKSGQTNNPKLVKYNSVINNNRNARKKGNPDSTTISSYKSSSVRYRNKYLRDMSFLFKDPKTGKRSYLTDSKVAYITKVAKKVTAGASTKYEKLLKIYEYLIDNFYYDNYAHETKKYQYVDPYRNLYNLRNKKNTNNSKNGKVATVCHGYSSMLVAMARNLNIPSRLVYGCHISQPLNIWADKSNYFMSDITHWWVEAYVNGRWIVIDPTSGSPNKWERTSFSSKGTWKKTGIRNYTYFDVSDELLSASHSYNKMRAGSNNRKYLADKMETKKLRSFFAKKSSGRSNGKRLNSRYAPYDYSTWGTKYNLETNGFGKTYKIDWTNEKLYGKLDLSGFKSLKYLYLRGNRIKSLNVANCSSLRSINVANNRLSYFNSTKAPKISYIYLGGNKKMKSAKLKVGKKVVTIKTKNNLGYFGFEYNKYSSKKLTIYADDELKGYKYIGIYNGAGKKLSSKTAYSINPSYKKYIVKYKKVTKKSKS